MNIIERIDKIFKANINAILDKAEDPAKMIDETLRELYEDLAEVKALPSCSLLPSPDQAGRQWGHPPSPELLPPFLCASLRETTFKLPPNSQ